MSRWKESIDDVFDSARDAGWQTDLPHWRTRVADALNKISQRTYFDKNNALLYKTAAYLDFVKPSMGDDDAQYFMKLLDVPQRIKIETEKTADIHLEKAECVRTGLTVAASLSAMVGSAIGLGKLIELATDKHWIAYGAAPFVAIPCLVAGGMVVNKALEPIANFFAERRRAAERTGDAEFVRRIEEYVAAYASKV
jgi:hypothetical protein